MWCRPNMWKLHAFTTLLTKSSNVRAVFNVTPSVFSLFNTMMEQPATVTRGGSGVLDNFCLVPRKQTPICPGSGEGFSPRISVEDRQCRTRGIGGRSGGLTRAV